MCVCVCVCAEYRLWIKPVCLSLCVCVCAECRLWIKPVCLSFGVCVHVCWVCVYMCVGCVCVCVCVCVHLYGLWIKPLCLSFGVCTWVLGVCVYVCVCVQLYGLWIQPVCLSFSVCIYVCWVCVCVCARCCWFDPFVSEWRGRGEWRTGQQGGRRAWPRGKDEEKSNNGWSGSRCCPSKSPSVMPQDALPLQKWWFSGACGPQACCGHTLLSLEHFLFVSVDSML